MVEKRGMRWLEESVKYVIEDKRNQYLALLQMMPIARSTMDSKSGRAMQKYYKDVAKNFENMTPWDTKNKRRVARTKNGKKLEPGKLVVQLDSGDDPNLALFKGATIL